MNEVLLSEIVKMLKPFQSNGTAIERTTDIAADLDLDSRAVMDLMMEVEDKFDISIPLNAIPEIRTVEDLVIVIGQVRGEA